MGCPVIEIAHPSRLRGLFIDIEHGVLRDDEVSSLNTGLDDVLMLRLPNTRVLMIQVQVLQPTLGCIS